MQPPTLTDADFAYPWSDLHERLDSAVTSLNSLRRQRTDADDQTRLAWKREGVEAARTVWDHLNDHIAAGTMTPAGAWRTFTARVTHLFEVPADDPGFYQGVHLALTYQRGYAPEIDAPRIENPHNSRDGR